MLKMHVSEVTLSVRRVLASLDIYYSNSLNTEVQKQSEALIKKLHTKFNYLQTFKTSNFIQLLLGFIAIHFFNRYQVFLNFESKQVLGSFGFQSLL